MFTPTPLSAANGYFIVGLPHCPAGEPTRFQFRYTKSVRYSHHADRPIHAPFFLMTIHLMVSTHTASRLDTATFTCVISDNMCKGLSPLNTLFPSVNKGVFSQLAYHKSALTTHRFPLAKAHLHLTPSEAYSSPRHPLITSMRSSLLKVYLQLSFDVQTDT